MTQGAVAEKETMDSFILTEKIGTAGVITLNRPKALNSIDLGMIRDLQEALKVWKEDFSISHILVKGAGEKAFCAGGDVRSVYDAWERRDRDYMDAIFREEYELNYALSVYPKPYISLINGISMGGGLGISIHGSHRIVTEKTVMAMPESAIGFFTDIGASFFLNKCPGKIGIYLGLTGDRVKGADALYCGLGTHFIDSEKLPSVYQQLLSASNQKDIDRILNEAITLPEKSFLEENQNLIDELFSGETVEDILMALKTDASEFAQKCFEGLQKKSPTSLKIIFELLKRHQGKTLKECLVTEFRLSQHFVEQPDFFEGVRALLVDKDQKPVWIPSSLSEIDQDAISWYFEELGEKELKLS
jgi:enoyl-CoA hydratase/carnithine racemase